MATVLDWQVLIGVRERRRDTAQQDLQREQRLTEACRQGMVQAETAWRAQLAARDAHAESTRQSVAGGASIAQLRHSSAWHGALGQRIAARAQALSEARERLARQRQAMAQARRALLKADAELEQAREMQQRRRREQRGLAERRVEDALDESGAQAWSAAGGRA